MKPLRAIILLSKRKDLINKQRALLEVKSLKIKKMELEIISMKKDFEKETDRLNLAYMFVMVCVCVTIPAIFIR
jgi:hypothetical protein